MATDVTKLVSGLNAHQVHAFKRLAVPVLMALRESIENGQGTMTIDLNQMQNARSKQKEVQYASDQPTASNS